MYSLLRNIRFYVLLISILLSGVIYLWVKTAITASELQIIRLEQIYAFISIIYLYVTLLIGPLCYSFRTIPFREHFMKARRALGVAVFYFALLHAAISLFGQLDGFAGIGFLGNTFLIAVILGIIALCILFLLTITSLDIAVGKLTFPKWKLLHRLVYFAGIVTLIHTVMLGTHFSDLSGVIPQISFILLAFLLLLEAPRINIWVSKRYPLPQFTFTTTIFILIIGVAYFSILSPFVSKSGNSISFDIHAAHKQLAQQALQQSQQNSFQSSFTVDINKIPGLNGDRTKRYTVSLIAPDTVQPNQDTTLRFRVYDSSSGNQVSFFRIIFAKPMHLMITDSTLSYFSHIHPIQQGKEFVVTTQFPQTGLYHLYIEFQPFGGIEQQIGFTLPVEIGVNDTIAFPTQPVDTTLTKTFGDYKVTLNTHGILNARDMTLGSDQISFTIKNAKTKQPITTLKPYLSSFGHLTMINEKTYDFVHVHPYNLTFPPQNANGGPTVDFLPIGIYGPFKPGVYRAFAEFNPDGKLFTADFTFKVE